MDLETAVCVSTGTDFVTIQVRRRAPPTAVELLCTGGWFSSSAWAPAEHYRCINVGEPGTGPPAYHITVSRLAAGIEYQVKLSWTGSGQPLVCTCRTAGPPPVLEPPTLIRRWPGALLVQWRAPSPAGAETTDCQMLFAKDSVFAQWDEASNIIRLASARPSLRQSGAAAATSTQPRVESWRALVEGLKPGTDYLLKVRAMNKAGWSEAFSEELRGRTSDCPAPPQQLRVAERRVGSVVLEMEVEDPEGAPITSIQVELFSVVQWHSAGRFDVAAGAAPGEAAAEDSARHGAAPTAPVGPRSCRVEVKNLLAGSNSLRLWAVSSIGRSMEPVQIDCRPSGRPAPVTSLECVGRLAAALRFQWSAADEEGAPVLECSMQYCRYSLMALAMWQDVPKDVLRRVDGESQRWQANVVGLDPDTFYQVRVRAKNEVGISDEVAEPLLVSTASPPETPVNLRCVKGLLSEVQLAFELPVDLVQMRFVAPISQIFVEEAGYLVWTKVPMDQVKLEMSPPVAAAGGAGSDYMQPGTVNCRLLVAGLTSATWYTFRLWLANDVGWCRGNAPVVKCHTALPPETPVLLGITTLGPNSGELLWSVADPAFAPVLQCDVEIRENSVFAARRLAKCSELQCRRPPGVKDSTSDAHKLGPEDVLWDQIIDGLSPQCEYFFRVRARNEVDLSKWSAEVLLKTSSLPEVIACEVARAAGDDKALIVIVSVADPPGAPVLLCSVTEKGSGLVTLCGSAGAGLWQATLPDARSSSSGLSVRLGNSVGWSTVVEVPKEEGPSERALPRASRAAAAPVASFVDALRAREVGRCDAQVRRLQALLDEARSNFRARAAMLLECRCTAAAKLAAALAELSPGALGALDGPRCSTWRGRHSTLLASWEQKVARARSAAATETPNEDSLSLVAAEALGVLLEGALWTERLCSEGVEPLIGSLGPRMLSLDAPRFFNAWMQEQKTWAPRFRRSLAPVFDTAAMTALRLLCTAAECGPLGEAEAQLPVALTALCALRDSAESHRRKLRHFESMLEQVNSSSSKGFEEVSVVDKVSTSAVTLLLGLALPVPGSFELGAFSIGALWLEGDSAGRHAIVEHPRENGPEAPLRRFRQRPTREARRLLGDWAEGRCENGLLVHNATARVITVRLLEGNEGLLKKAYAKLQQAHPYARWVASTVEHFLAGQEGNELMLPVVVVAPAGVALLQMTVVDTPTGLSGAEAAAFRAAAEQPFEAEFAYGIGEHAERAVGRVLARRGGAASFVCLDHELHVDNGEEAMTADAAGGPDALGAAAGGESAGPGAAVEVFSAAVDDAVDGSSMPQDTIAAAAAAPAASPESARGAVAAVRSTEVEVRNQDFTQIKVSFYHPTGSHIRLFEKPALSITVDRGENRRVVVPPRDPRRSSAGTFTGLASTLSHVMPSGATQAPTPPPSPAGEGAGAEAAPQPPQPSAAASAGGGGGAAAASAADAIDVDGGATAWGLHGLLEVELVAAGGKKSWCHLLSGQILSYEGCL